MSTGYTDVSTRPPNICVNSNVNITINMTNISHTHLTSKDYQSVTDQLIKLIARLNKHTAPFLINELLTESERIMVVKRFGAILMFNHGYSCYRVSTTLGLSMPTSSRLRAQYVQGQYKNVIANFPKNEQSAFLSLIHDLIIAQASPKARARLLNRALAHGRK